MNTFSDWLSLNEWVKGILLSETISAQDKSIIKKYYQELKDEGIPILYSYREKYDDPFEEFEGRTFSEKQFSGTSIKWNEFNVAVNIIINKYNVSSPYKNANSSNVFQEILNQVRDSNTFIIFNYISTPGILVVYSCGEKFHSISMPLEEYSTFREVLYSYQRKFKTLDEFRSILLNTISFYGPYFKNLISMLISSSDFNLIIMNESDLKLLPITSILYENKLIREMIIEGKIRIYHAPIVAQSKYQDSDINKFLGLFEPFEELPLLESELMLSQQLNSFDRFEIINLSTEFDAKNISDADFIHIASHGFPISNFTDPIFASLSGPISKNSFSLEKIQRDFNEFDYKITFLSMCDSSDMLNSNFFKHFKTDEGISYPSLFLLNQKSVVISINWPILDLIPYIFTHYLLIELGKKGIFEAFCSAQIQLYTMNVSELLDILENIEDKQLRIKKKDMFKYANPSSHPFRHPYIFGAFTLSSLII